MTASSRHHFRTIKPEVHDHPYVVVACILLKSLRVRPAKSHSLGVILTHVGARITLILLFARLFY